MYNTFFGFREKPFKLVPNPDYLFLSKSHEVALAHLNYATEQGDGFVVITGEVGTGKTTLCRNYLEQLDDQTDSAYIFNPQLDAIQLLTTICHEFGIETGEDSTIKDLLDTLNQYLIAQNMAGRQVVLLIDEAQALTVESLEMVRMVSNLETTRSKLLQIILVGQPELGDKLDTYELRQLAQRISLNCYLTPLTEKETLAYMQHRVNIAAQRKSDIFSAKAAQQIYRYAAGIPRLINIACDRALLSAYSQNNSKVSGSMIKKVVAELSGRNRAKDPPRFKPIYLWLPLLVLILVAACVVIYQMGLFQQHSSSGNAAADTAEPVVANRVVQSFKVPNNKALINNSPVNKAPANTASNNKPALEFTPTPPEEPLEKSEKDNAAPTVSTLQETLSTLDPQTSRMNALTTMLAQWGQPPPNPAVIPSNMDERNFFQIAARQYGLRAYVMALDWDMLKLLNLPAIVVFDQPQTQQLVYLAFVEWTPTHILLADGGLDRTVETDIDTLKSHAQGTVYVYWKNTLGYDAIISYGAHARAIVVVKTMLRKVGYDHLSTTPEFDRSTLYAVRDFQKRQKIKADGLVGPLTKILLIQQAKAFNVPSLSPDREAGV